MPFHYTLGRAPLEPGREARAPMKPPPPMQTTLLAGDVGGTKTDLALFADDRPAGGRLRELRGARLASADYPGLGALLRAFLGDAPPPIAAAAFGVAGPVVGDTCRTTNLPWEIDAAALRAALGIPRLRLLNDFHALALGLGALPDDGLLVLQPGDVDPAGPQAVIGAGTGLGEAILVPTAAGPRVLATEGGHADFAPRDDLEIGLLRALQRRHGHVSWERLVSGPGLVALHDHLAAEGLAVVHPDTRRRLAAEDPAAVIGELALADADPSCVLAVDRFLGLYGAEAGNLALKTLPTGGLFVAGGIAPRLLPKLRRGPFLAAFLDKGRMRPLLERIRVAVVLEPRVGLLGAARAAVDLLEPT